MFSFMNNLYASSALPANLYILFFAACIALGCVILFPRNLEFLAIPLFLTALNNFIFTIKGLFTGSDSFPFSLIFSFILLIVFWFSTTKESSPKTIKYAALVYGLGNLVLSVIKLASFGPPNLANYISLLSVLLFDIAIAISFFFASTNVNATPVEIPKKKLVTLLIIVVVGVLIFLLVTLLPLSASFSSSVPSCGHDSCKENGPFPCYGKNNTCPNYTDCAFDFYCDSCENNVSP